MSAIILRNLRVFFRDRLSVFFSLLGAIIIIGLYALFLGNVIVGSMEGIPGARFLADSWIMAGLLGVTSITTTMGAFGIMVEDRSRKTLKDFSASPLSRRKLAGGYILSSYTVGVIMSALTFVLAELYILAYGGSLLPIDAIFKVLSTILLSTLSASAMVFFMVSFFKSASAFATASTILGTMIGFLTGIYIPVGQLPAGVQAVIKFFPPSHAGVLFRQIMMEAPMQTAFAGAPTEIVEAFSQEMGVVFTLGGTTLTWVHSALYLLLSAAVFYALAVFSVSRKNR